jgi:hypothetical protein
MKKQMAFRTSFERVYGFELLDELHNFFPELMYDDTIFNDHMAAYMRHRVRTLFPNVYTRNENMYNIYERVNRRRNYDVWRDSYFPSIAAPPPPRNTTFQIPVARNRIDVDVSGAEAPGLETPPPITRGRLLGVNTLGGTRAPRREISWFAGSFPRQQTKEPTPLIYTEDTTLTTGLLNLLGLGLMGTGAGAGAGAGLFQDVEVSLTTEQITAGSQIREAADVPPETVCAICLDHPSEDSSWRALRCSHMYHTECIDTWFRSHVACPVCRTDLRTFSQG